jgi:DNA gyrase subunit A
MELVPGPDLPTGAQLLGMTEVRAAYETGRGVVRMRATADVEPLLRGKSQITVTEMPYGVGAERVIAKVKELVTGKKLQGISDIKDLTDRHRGTQLVIEVKAGFNPQAVLAELYRLTPLEESFGINNLALVDGQPRTLGLKELLQVFLDHRVDVVTRRSRYRLRKAQERAHLVEGCCWPGQHRRGRAHHPGLADVAEARAALTDALRRCPTCRPATSSTCSCAAWWRWRSRSSRPSWPSCARASPSSSASSGDPAVLRGVISDELAAVAADHGTPRRTVLVGGDLKALVAKRATSLEVADEPCDVVLSSAGLVARTPLQADGDAGGGRRRTGRVRHDVVLSTARTTTRGVVGLVTSAGRVVRANVLDLPAVPAVTTGALSVRGGAPVSEFAALQRGERVLALTPMAPDGPGLALGTRQGVVKRVTPDWAAKGEVLEVIALKPGDEVVGAAELRDGEEELVFFASTGDLLRFPASAVRPQGRSAGGMAGIKLAAGATVVGFSAVDLAPPEGRARRRRRAGGGHRRRPAARGARRPADRAGVGRGVEREGHAAVGVPAQGPGDRRRARAATAHR